MALSAGTARACITPPTGFRLGGYGSRDHGCEGVHDDLFAKALFLSDGDGEAAVITADLLGLRGQRVERVRQRVTELTGIGGDRVMVACSHTHGGPLMASDLTSLPAEHEAYLDALCQYLAGTVAAARAAAVPVRVRRGRAPVRVGANRREHRADGTTVLGVDLGGPLNPWVDVLAFECEGDEAPVAVLFQHAVHGTCLTGDNYLVTADAMGVAQRTIEAALPGVCALFLNGCAGDINPYPRGTFAWCQRHGARLGGAALAAAMDVDTGLTAAAAADVDAGLTATWTADTDASDARDASGASAASDPGHAAARDASAPRLVCHQSRFLLPLEPAPGLAECERLYAELEPQYAALGGQVHRNWWLARRFADVRDQLAAARQGQVEPGLPVEVQVLALGQTALVSLPGEIFVRIGRQIAARSPFAATWPVGYANGYIGYVPTREEIPYGGYEVSQGRARWQGRFVSEDADQALVDGAVAALEQAAALGGRRSGECPWAPRSG